MSHRPQPLSSSPCARGERYDLVGVLPNQGSWIVAAQFGDWIATFDKQPANVTRPADMFIGPVAKPADAGQLTATCGADTKTVGHSQMVIEPTDFAVQGVRYPAGGRFGIAHVECRREKATMGARARHPLGSRKSNVHDEMLRGAQSCRCDKGLMKAKRRPDRLSADFQTNRFGQQREHLGTRQDQDDGRCRDNPILRFGSSPACVESVVGQRLTTARGRGTLT